MSNQPAETSAGLPVDVGASNMSTNSGLVADGASSEDELDEALADIREDEPVVFPPTQPVKLEPTSLHAPTLPAWPAPSAFPHPESSWTPSAAGPSKAAAPRSASPFKAPPNPHIPQDLSLIAEMVSSHQVVGALPPLHMTAAEKRRLVQESMKKGKAKAVDADPAPSASAPSAMVEEESDGDSDSSSELLSDEEDEQPAVDAPMTEAEHDDLKAGLDKLMNGNSVLPPPGREVESDEDDSSEYMTDDDDEGIDEIDADILLGAGSGKGRVRLEELMDDDEDGPGGPIVSTNEAPLPPVPQPPLRRLPTTEKLTLAGDVLSWMKEKKVEAWLEKERLKEEKPSVEETKEGGSQVEAGEVVEPSADLAAAPSPAPTPKFNSAGTVVIRGMQENPGLEGWLEEGSVLCWQDGRVLGTVSDTFGPLTSPFYLIRLPPPPHPYPSSSDLSAGTRIFYPSNPTYRRFVDMHAVRDPRFKGSDASNFHDEEVGEDEMEWSDDEAEAEAKRRRKNKRSGSNASRGSARGGGRGRDRGYPTAGGSVGGRHFDYPEGEDHDDAGSLYGGEGGEEYDNWSDAGSVASGASGRARARPEPYEVDEDMSGGAYRFPREAGRGQGRQRGRGRGGRGGRGGGGRRDDRRPPHSPGHGHGHGLPPRPMDNYTPLGHPHPSYQSGGGGYQQNWNQPPPQHYSPQSSYSPQPQMQAAPGGFFPAPMSSWAPPSPSGGSGGGGPAINPRFAAAAAQYSQILQQPGWGQQGNHPYSQ